MNQSVLQNSPPDTFVIKFVCTFPSNLATFADLRANVVLATRHSVGGEGSGGNTWPDSRGWEPADSPKCHHESAGLVLAFDEIETTAATATTCSFNDKLIHVLLHLRTVGWRSCTHASLASHSAPPCKRASLDDTVTYRPVDTVDQMPLSTGPVVTLS
ncbi:unnamed protein product [Protopolystoma xenopodis]|uniref:Uncharacterized protein n=1 Tax=Protopolystoma xenopodis TaxID=117903 RepID=A0A3S5B475_9PLAT|nr:unnamed protein product [Protopolystoma xenopodis]